MRCVTYKELPQKRRFGVELELSSNLTKSEVGDKLVEFESLYGLKKSVKVTPGETGWAQTQRNNYWHVKYDSTCGVHGKGVDHGWEIASYIGQGPDDIHHISRAARFLENAGAQTNLNCGFHVHVETTDFTQKMMGVLIARWLKIEPVLVSICHTSRWKNEYCQTLRRRAEKLKIKYVQDAPNDFWLHISPKDLNVHNNYEKRYTLNTIGFATSQIIPDYNRNTVELRLPESKLDEGHVKNWIRLILNFVESCSQNALPPNNLDQAKDLSETLYYLGLSGVEDFYVLDPELLSLKVWFLKKLVATLDPRMATESRKHLDFISSL